MDEQIDRIYSQIVRKKHRPTSDLDLLKAIDTKIVRHEDLGKYKNINQILKNRSSVIFYNNTAGDIGHWCCLTQRGNILEYFDSYGRRPSYEKYIHGDSPYLDNLLKKSEYDVRYNPFNFQKGRTSTCGRHVVTRILYKDYPLMKYKKIMDGIDADDLVSFLTFPI